MIEGTTDIPTRTAPVLLALVLALHLLGPALLEVTAIVPVALPLDAAWHLPTHTHQAADHRARVVGRHLLEEGQGAHVVMTIGERDRVRRPDVHTRRGVTKGVTTDVMTIEAIEAGHPGGISTIRTLAHHGHGSVLRHLEIVMFPQRGVEACVLLFGQAATTSLVHGSTVHTLAATRQPAIHATPAKAETTVAVHRRLDVIEQTHTLRTLGEVAGRLRLHGPHMLRMMPQAESLPLLHVALLRRQFIPAALLS